MGGLIEGTIIAGKVLAPHAGKVAGLLVRKMTYRIRVRWKVRRQTGVRFPRRAYSAWLKELGASDLSIPVEAAAPPLALLLDAQLSASNADWAATPDHLSRALKLVEATYLVILAIEEPGQARLLAEQWARHRNQSLVHSLAELAGGYSTGLSDDDLRVWLLRRSDERRSVRLAPFAVEIGQVEEQLAFARRQVPAVPSGSVRTLVGVFGMGKSEIAEEWHRIMIDAFNSEGAAPVPVWLDARAVARAGFEQSLFSAIGIAGVRHRSVALVVDGLDELGDGAVAEAIVRDARVFVAGNVQSSVLITMRPGTVQNSSDAVMITGLPRDDATKLIERVSGQAHATWRWSDELLETVRSPFFAVAAGALLAAGEVPAGEADLIRKLVEQALRRRPSGSTTEKHEVFETLVSLGIALTRSNGQDGQLMFRQRELVRSTRLTTELPDGRVTFALPIFEQWFAAQGLLVQRELEAEVFASPSAFGRWRWALAVAVLSAEVERADELVEACIRFNPGGGAWLVEQVSVTQRLGDHGEVGLEPALARARLLRATRTWIDALGPAAPFFFPVGSAPTPIHLGVRVAGRRVTRAWARQQPLVDKATDLPLEIHPFNQEDRRWLCDWSGGVPRGPAWPWVMVRDDIARNTLEMLEGPGILGPVLGIWHRERLYRAARILVGARGSRFQAIARATVLDQARRLLSEAAGLGEPAIVMFQRGSSRVSGAEVVGLIDWLQGADSDVIERPVPAPDVSQPRDGWVWNLYTPEHLVRYCAEVLGQACEAYEEMSDTVFARFGWSLSASAYGRFGAIGWVTYPEPGKILGDAPGLEYGMLPMSLLDEEIRAHPDMYVSVNGRAAVGLGVEANSAQNNEEWLERVARLRIWIADVRDDRPFRRSATYSGTVIEPHHERPVSLQAASWIWDDLNSLSLGKGTFPQLQR